MWSFILADLSGLSFGEMTNATERQLTFGLNRAAQATWKMRGDITFLDELLSSDLTCRVYQDGVLRFHGYVVLVEVATDEFGFSASCTAVDPSWRLTKRLAGIAANGTTYTNQDRLVIVKAEIDGANSASNTGVKTQAMTSGTLVTYVAGPYKPIATVITELGDSVDGFEWYVSPQELDANGRIGLFNAASTIGSAKADAVFEYGGSKANLSTFSYKRDWADIANRVRHVPDEGSNSTLGVRTLSDDASIALRGWYDVVIDAPGISDQTMRDTLLSEHLQARAAPRRVFTMTPLPDDGSGRVPIFNTDFGLGDTVRARAVDNSSDTTLLDGVVRLYQMQITIDDNGQETYTPTLVDEGAAA